ncbi:MAG: PQQ-binding-like beta-propeller repeat protein [Synergistaceae bacterium]|nr:PQQ-binding-like beta-propeller repeat protein [Synergistaceae bacterium]
MKRKALIIALILSLTAITASAVQRPVARIDSQITTGIAVSGSLVMFGDSVGKFYALDSSTKSYKWASETEGSSAIGIPAVQGNSAVFAQSDGHIYCLRISDGETIWSYEPEFSESETEGLSDGPVIGGEYVYAAFSSGTLRALNLKNGKVAWTYKAEQGLRTAPAYGGGLVLLGEYNGIFSMIDAKTGKRVNGGGAGGAINSPAVNGGNVYYSAWDGSVHAVQIKDVIPLWDSKVGEPITTAPVISDGLIVVCTATGKVIALDEKNGSILWQYSSQGGDSGVRPSIRGDKVFAGTGDNRVIVLNAGTGKLIRETPDAHAISTSGSTKLYYVSGNNLFAEE